MSFPYVTKTYENGVSGYIIWSNKLCMQWSKTSVSSGTVVSLLQKYKNTNYNLTAYDIHGDGLQDWCNSMSFHTLTTSSFKVYRGYSGSTTLSWCAIGYM